MQAVKEILQVHGYESAADMDVGDSVKVELDSEAMIPLTIEKVADNYEFDLSGASFDTERDLQEHIRLRAGARRESRRMENFY